jgi:hypothetical protein
MKRIVLTPEQEKRFKHVAYATYETIGFDVGWAETTPSKALFAEVLRDQMHDGTFGHPPFTDAERDLWRALPSAVKNRIILSVGP